MTASANDSTTNAKVKGCLLGVARSSTGGRNQGLWDWDRGGGRGKYGSADGDVPQVIRRVWKEGPKGTRGPG